MKLIETNNSNTREICELENTVTNTRQELDKIKGRVAKDRAAPSSAATTEPAGQRDKGVAPSGGARMTLLAEVAGGKIKQKTFKITVTGKGNQTAETTKQVLKSHFNPTEIRVGVNCLKLQWG
jgi:hypothetical protein